MQLGVCAVSVCLNAIVHFHICTVTVWSRAAHKRIECMPLIACICTTIRECNTTCAAFYFIVWKLVRFFFCGFTSYARRIKYKCANHAHSANCDSCDDATLHIIYTYVNCLLWRICVSLWAWTREWAPLYCCFHQAPANNSICFLLFPFASI